MLRSLPAVVVVALLGLQAPAWAQDEPAPTPSEAAEPADSPAATDGTTLPLGKAEQVQLGDAAAIYTVVTEEAGMLSVFVRAAGQTDVAFVVTDADGQGLPNGKADQDHDGLVGAEQLLVNLPWPGTYHVHVFAASSCKAVLGASWVPVPEMKRAEDADFSPSQGKQLALDEKLEDAIDPRAGDRWDWFYLEAEQAGALTVVLRAPEGDLALEAYAHSSYLEPIVRSDDDQGEVAGNESVTIQAEAGKVYRFRVLAPRTAGGGGGGKVAYKISAGLIAE